MKNKIAIAVFLCGLGYISSLMPVAPITKYQDLNGKDYDVYSLTEIHKHARRERVAANGFLAATSAVALGAAFCCPQAYSLSVMAAYLSLGSAGCFFTLKSKKTSSLGYQVCGYHQNRYFESELKKQGHDSKGLFSMHEKREARVLPPYLAELPL